MTLYKLQLSLQERRLILLHFKFKENTCKVSFNNYHYANETYVGTSMIESFTF